MSRTRKSPEKEAAAVEMAELGKNTKPAAKAVAQPSSCNSSFFESIFSGVNVGSSLIMRKGPMH